MATGTYGSFAFGKVGGSWRTFYSVTRTEAGRYEDAAVWLNKPSTERAGPDLISLEVKLCLNAAWCGDPRPIVSALQIYERNQLAATLLLGGKAMGPGASMFTLRELSETQTHWLRRGEPLRIELDLSFVEYNPSLIMLI